MGEVREQSTHILADPHDLGSERETEKNQPPLDATECRYSAGDEIFGVGLVEKPERHRTGHFCSRDALVSAQTSTPTASRCSCRTAFDLSAIRTATSSEPRFSS